MSAELETNQLKSDTVRVKRHSRRGGRKKPRPQHQPQKGVRADYQPFVRDNANFEKYYIWQYIWNDNEFDQFMASLRETLPASFRINAFDESQAKLLRHLVEQLKFQEAEQAKPIESQHDPASEHDATQKPKLFQGQPTLEALCWYPKRLCWQMNISRVDLRKNPVLQQLHKFLIAETDNGFISRQEAVSMIPPLVLDVHRGQYILDMCAAPGSKTAQLLEYLKTDTSAPESADCFDEGLVVANDVDNKRCYMLVHQSSRLNSPNCVIINQDASKLPNMKTFIKESTDFVDLKFDRILCDVPCSGDGTLRKNPDVWKKWGVGNANNFHGIQCKILKRGIELLKENGLIVYSTCSMNPVEDEAVISHILRASDGKVKLEDVSHRVPGLKFKPGVTKWIVMNRDMDLLNSFNDVTPEYASQCYPSLFPPSEDEIKQFELHKCMRVLPHLQNTGGFFVAVLRKLAPEMPWEATDDTSQNNGKASAPNPKKRRFGGFKEDPFFFLEPSDPDWEAIKKGYGFNDSFPVKQLGHRCVSGKKRSIYLMSKKTRGFIIANKEEPDREDFVKIINAGMRLFSRADTESGFRICQDGVNEILPYIRDDLKVPITQSDLIALLKSRTVNMDLLSQAQYIKDSIKQGSFILMYKHSYEDLGEMTMPLVAWKGEKTIALYVSNNYRVHLCAVAQLKVGDDSLFGSLSDAKVEVEEEEIPKEE